MKYNPNKKLICDFEELICKLEKDPFILIGERFALNGMSLIQHTIRPGLTIGLAYNLNKAVAITLDEKNVIWRRL